MLLSPVRDIRVKRVVRVTKAFVLPPTSKNDHKTKQYRSELL